MIKTNSMIRQTIVVSLMMCSALWGQSAGPASAPPARPGPAALANRFPRNYVPTRARMYYGLLWGVDQLSVKYTESGEIIRFSYRVIDPERAQVLNDKKLEPSLIDPAAGVSLVVPALEQVGRLRRTPRGQLEAGKSYWMAFSNVGRRVKKGDRVIVAIGNFHVDGLIVE
jgi:hypothetical protein